MSKSVAMGVVLGCLIAVGCPGGDDTPSTSGPVAGDSSSTGNQPSNDSGSTSFGSTSSAGPDSTGNDSTGSASMGNDSTGNSSSPPSDSSGGGPMCAACADALDGTAEVWELCGTNPPEGLCSQDTACQRHRVLRNCWCVECEAECSAVCPAMAMVEGETKNVDATCQACRDTASAGACMAEATACMMDTGA